MANDVIDAPPCKYMIWHGVLLGNTLLLEVQITPHESLHPRKVSLFASIQTKGGSDFITKENVFTKLLSTHILFRVSLGTH